MIRFLLLATMILAVVDGPGWDRLWWGLALIVYLGLIADQNPANRA
jgi:hypothetical protein